MRLCLFSAVLHQDRIITMSKKGENFLLRQTSLVFSVPVLNMCPTNVEVLHFFILEPQESYFPSLLMSRSFSRSQNVPGIILVFFLHLFRFLRLAGCAQGWFLGGTELAQHTLCQISCMLIMPCGLKNQIGHYCTFLVHCTWSTCGLLSLSFR